MKPGIAIKLFTVSASFLVSPLACMAQGPALTKATIEIQTECISPYDPENVPSSTPIRTEAELRGMVTGRYYYLCNDIHLSDELFSPIGGTPSSPFFGIGGLDGQNHTIFNLRIYRPGDVGVGLFSKTRIALIANLRFNGAQVVGGSNVGIVAGESASRIRNILVTNSRVTGDTNVGAIVGLNQAQQDTTGFYQRISFLSVDAFTLVQGRTHVGGIVGQNRLQGIISQAQSQAIVRASFSNAGGVAGINTDQGLITDSWSAGSVSANNNAGGLVGVMLGGAYPAGVLRSFSRAQVSGGQAGGLIASLSVGEARDSFYNSDLFPTANGIGTPLTTAQMIAVPRPTGAYANFDFSGVWNQLNGSYPSLRWP